MPPWTPRAVLLDAFGTLVTFGDPAARLQIELRARAGLEVSLAEARAAMRAEVAYYISHHDSAVDAAALAVLRRDCGAVVREALGSAAERSDLDAVTAALVAAIRFEPFPEVPAVLAALRARGARLVVVSNWDVSLHAVLAETGLAPSLDAVLTSAEERRSKPDPELFLRALARVERSAEDAIHAGDSIAHDVAGARAAGVRPVLVRRAGTGGDEPEGGLDVVGDLAGLLTLTR